MKRRTFIFGILTAAAMLLAGTSPAMAARLVSVEAEAGEQQVSREGNFRLSGQTQVVIGFNANVQNGGRVQVHVDRKLPNGQWQRINTPLDTNSSQRGEHKMTLHAGEYRIQIVATNAQASVTVDN